MILADGSCTHCGRWTSAGGLAARNKANRLGGIYRQIAALVGNEAQPPSGRHAAPLAALWRLQPGPLPSRRHHRPLSTAGPALQPGNLLCGAEGTLAAITELKLKLVPRPQSDRPGDHRVSRPARSARGHAGDPRDGAVGGRVDRRLEPAHGACQARVQSPAACVSARGAFCFLAVEYCGASEHELEAKTRRPCRPHLAAKDVMTGPITPLLGQDAPGRMSGTCAKWGLGCS